jgi:hypothetical protein
MSISLCDEILFFFFMRKLILGTIRTWAFDFAKGFNFKTARTCIRLLFGYNRQTTLLARRERETNNIPLSCRIRKVMKGKMEENGRLQNAQIEKRRRRITTQRERARIYNEFMNTTVSGQYNFIELFAAKQE